MNDSRRSRTGLELAILAIPVAAWIFFSLAGKDLRGGAFLIGDGPYYAATTLSLRYDGDVALGNQLRGGLPVHQKQVALSHDGRLMPKHPILISLLSVPFFALFGVSGFLIVNVLVMLLLVLVVWATARTYVGAAASILATWTIFGGTFLRAYVYGYQPDLLSTLLVLAGILGVVRTRLVTGGLFLGLSGLVKVTNFFAAAVVVIVLLFRRPRTQALRTALGMVPGVAAWMLINLMMFGGPTVTGYDRTIVLQDGVPHLVSHRDFFDLPILEGMRGHLFHPRVGLLVNSAVLLLAIPGFVLFFRRRRWDAALFFVVSEFLFLLFSGYRWYASSHYGNRFLIVPVVLAAVPIAFLFEAVLERVRPRVLEKG